MMLINCYPCGSVECIAVLYMYYHDDISFTTGVKVLFYPSRLLKNSSLATENALTKRQSLRYGHFSIALKFFSLPLEIGPHDNGPLGAMVAQW